MGNHLALKYWKLSSPELWVVVCGTTPHVIKALVKFTTGAGPLPISSRCSSNFVGDHFICPRGARQMCDWGGGLLSLSSRCSSKLSNCLRPSCHHAPWTSFGAPWAPTGHLFAPPGPLLGSPLAPPGPPVSRRCVLGPNKSES